MVPITENDLALFRERAKTELKSTGDIGRLAWDDVVEALCKEVARLRSASEERGDAAKLREALRECAQYIACVGGIGVGEVTINDNVHLIPEELTQKAIAALAAPPRNCDRFANAVEAMAELKRVHSYCAKENRRCLEDCPDCGKEWCSLAWLFALATESEAQA